MFAYCGNDPVNKVDPSGEFGTPIQWACAVIGGIAGWFFGDYVAKQLGYSRGWKYWAIRAGVVIGGAVIGWFAGTAIMKIATRFLLSNPSVMAKIPAGVLSFLGLSINGNSIKFTQTCIGHMNDPNRFVPVQWIVNCIKYGKAKPDPRGTQAIIYTISNFYKNGKQYNLEVLFNWGTKTILHFKYWR